MPTITKDSRATIKTSFGDVVLSFLTDKAPKTVENFVTLCNKGFYDGLTFHRVIKDFMIQGGCPKGNGSGNPGYTIRPEFNDTPHVKGTVSMARSNDPHSAGSQFFIVHGEARYLDSRYTAFAQVEDGMDVVDKIAEVPTNMETRYKELSVPRTPVYINTIELEGVEIEEAAPQQQQQQQQPQQQQPQQQRNNDDGGGGGGKSRGRGRRGRGGQRDGDGGGGRAQESRDGGGDEGAKQKKPAGDGGAPETQESEQPAKAKSKKATKAKSSKTDGAKSESKPKAKSATRKKAAAKSGSDDAPAKPKAAKAKKVTAKKTTTKKTTRKAAKSKKDEE